ncbi:hypothetical protein BDV34DRAFT_208275 [Aspergillus parasiticus]|uniref:Uncharacterized protein n=1 Tax=Aspergillus parasiticus TaxID=5067 RepID=A0A5N6E6R7_ASPPA|nr:hypothetical protein BDV34DRAFT_208275 [Aspergillus parasiticus]
MRMLVFILLIGLVAAIGSLLCSLMIAAFLWRRLVLLNSDIKRDFIGKPLLFPARLTHTRRFPETERYNYWYDYFLIGIPVGLRGRVGNLLSIDNIPQRERLWEKCWFTIDPTYYLDRGSGDRSLEEKLHVFLKSVGEDLKEFPYAYLISVPRFLWFQKSAISYWYLYSSNRELTAMIMEINNSFFEKRNFFFRVTGDGLAVDSDNNWSTTTMALAKGYNDKVSLRFSSSISTSKQYKGSWEKDIFGSPFEKVGGLMVSKSIDPVVGPSLQSNLSSNTPDGQVKVTSRLSSWGEPVDPLKAPGWIIARFIARWTHVGALSAPRIVKEALRIRLRGRLTYLKRPEVRPGSIARKETEVERDLELPFRQYLSELTSHTSFPLSIKYIPPKSIHFDDITFYSPACTTSSQPILTIQPLTPRFYTSFPQYDSPRAAFTNEARATPMKSDESSCRLSISDHSLLVQVLATAGQTLDTEAAKLGPRNPKDWESNILQKVLSFLRKSPAETFMDRFVSHYVHPSLQYRLLLNAKCSNNPKLIHKQLSVN